MRRVGGSYVSCILRMKEVIQIFGSDDAAADFLRDFGSILHPDDMAKKLGFFKHPTYFKASQDKANFTEKRRLANCFMYSLDVLAQYKHQKANEAKRKKHAQQKANVVKQWRAENPRFSAALLETAALADHLQGFLGRQPGNVVFTVAGSQPTAMSDLPSRLSATDRPPGARENVLQLQPDVEGDVVSEPQSPQSDMFCFRVVPVRLDRQKVVAMPAAHARRLSKLDFCVTVHASQASSDGTLVSAEASQTTSVSSPVAVLTLCNADLDTMKSKLTAWVTRKSPCYLLDGVRGSVTEDAKDALMKLVSSRAFPSSSHVLQVADSDRSLLRQLESLRECRIVQLVDAKSDHSKWSFTAFGAGKLRVANKLRCPEPVFQPLTDVSLQALQDATTWQLFHALQSQGFQVRPKPARKREALALPPHTADNQDLLWYAPNTSLHRSRQYMIALLHSPVLFDRGVQRVRHCQPIKYYKMILEDGCCSSPVLELEDVARPALSLDVENPVAQQPEPQVLVNAAPASGNVRPRKRARREVGDPELAELIAFFDEDEQNEVEEEHRAPESENEAAAGNATDDSGLSSESLSSDFGFDASDAEHHPPSPAPVFAAVEAEDADVDNGIGIGSPLARPEPEPASPDDAGNDVPPPSPHLPDVDPEAHAEVPPVPPMPPRPAVERAAVVRAVHQDTFVWGQFRFTWSSPESRPPHGGWQAACPYHKKNQATSRSSCGMALLRRSNDAAAC